MPQSETKTGELKQKQPMTMESPHPQWRQAVKRKPGEALLKNMAMASALLLCAVALRNGAIPVLQPAADAVLTAASGDMVLDDQLGKLTFVSSLFPEAVLVFGEENGGLIQPVSGSAVIHPWSEEEPYLSWRCDSEDVVSAMAGEVIGVYHGEDEELLVQVMGEDGLSCVYGNLAEAAVFTGDAVERGDRVGRLSADRECSFEVRRDGYSIDPTALLGASP